MSTEEPTWKTELEAAFEAIRYRGVVGATPAMDIAIATARAAYAEGRREALAEIAARIMKYAHHDATHNCVVCHTHRFDADLADLDRQ